MQKIKKGDVVIVIAGKDKGKQGEILSIVGEKYLVKGINMVKKTVKANPNTNEQGGILDKEMPIHRSNVMMYDPNAKKRTRVGIRQLKDDGSRVRFMKASDQLIEAKA